MNEHFKLVFSKHSKERKDAVLSVTLLSARKMTFCSSSSSSMCMFL